MRPLAVWFYCALYVHVTVGIHCLSEEEPTHADPDCVFCRIVAGKIAVHRVFADDQVVAFLDNGPIRTGHTQIVPRRHFEFFDDLPSDLAERIMLLGQRIAKAQKKAFGVERVGFMFTGGDIRHAHAHLVPLVEPTDLTSRRYIKEERLTFSALPSPGDEALSDAAERIRKLL